MLGTVLELFVAADHNRHPARRASKGISPVDVTYTSCLEGLNKLSWNDLIEQYDQYLDNVPNEYSDEADLWRFEIAFRIAGFGTDGVKFLIQNISTSDDIHLRAILSALAWDKTQNHDVEAVASRYLDDARPLIVAEVIDLLRLLKYTTYRDRVVQHLSSSSPYVVGAVLRYFSQLFPDEAKPVLMEALGSDDPIIIQNAIDELDEMNATETLPSIVPLQEHDDKNVREAAVWAITRPRYTEDSTDDSIEPVL